MSQLYKREVESYLNVWRRDRIIEFMHTNQYTCDFVAKKLNVERWILQEVIDTKRPVTANFFCKFIFDLGLSYDDTYKPRELAVALGETFPDGIHNKIGEVYRNARTPKSKSRTRKQTEQVQETGTTVEKPQSASITQSEEKTTTQPPEEGVASITASETSNSKFVSDNGLVFKL